MRQNMQDYNKTNLRLIQEIKINMRQDMQDYNKTNMKLKHANKNK